MKRGIIWFRNDLRVNDQKALVAASRACDQLAALFIICPEQWQRHEWGAVKVDFVLRSLAKLNLSLGQLGIPLMVLETSDFSHIPTILERVTEKLACTELYYNHEYEINERRRDEAVARHLSKVNCHSFHDQVILRPGTVLTKSETYYTVYSPFRRAWARVHEALGEEAQPAIEKRQPQKTLELKISDLSQERVAHVKWHPTSNGKIPDYLPAFKLQEEKAARLKTYWPAGETEALKRLNHFSRHVIEAYDHDRDFPSLEGTSSLSPYLAVGSISPRDCLKAGLEAGGVLDPKVVSHHVQGATRWISELIWREFYKHLLVGFPRLSMDQPFKLTTRQVAWRDDPSELKAWQEGRTGFPIVDAAMRQLHQIGWMHNRLRMIVAMFLTKDLLLHWRHGECFFMRHLVDADLAANNGGWQWSASTGTDAQPYFRIFNPIAQSQKFDPEGTFIRKYIPELKHLDSKGIHQPYRQTRQSTQMVLTDTALDYPRQIVDHAHARDRALKAFKAI